MVKRILKIVLVVFGLLVVAGIVIAAIAPPVPAQNTAQTNPPIPVEDAASSTPPDTSIPVVTSSSVSTATGAPKNTTTPTYGVQTKTTSCVANQALPDSACTPGAILTTDTSVICVSGYTQTVRDVSDSLKKKVFAEYGIDYSLHGNYEVDHLISLELGGSNDISNLWPEPHDITNGSLTKDKLENYLHAQACKGAITMQQAQYEIATNWIKYYPSSLNSTPTSTSVPAPTTAQTTNASASTQTAAAYYTSSYSTSKYYYPAACSAWKSLSPSYLKSFDTLDALLVAYPSRSLSPQCP